MCLQWIPRLQNEEADALSNEIFTGFDLGKRITIDPAAVQWKVLPRMIVYGSDLQSRVDEAKAAAASPESDTTPCKKRKLGETLRSADPW